MTASALSVAVIGAGPVSLTAAAHLLARGREPMVPEAGPLIDPNLHSCGTVRPHGEAELRHPEAAVPFSGCRGPSTVPAIEAASVCCGSPASKQGCCG